MYFSKKKIGFFISGENGVISLGKHDEKLEKKKKSSQNVVIRVTDKVTKLYADSTIKKDKERRGLTLRLSFTDLHLNTYCVCYSWYAFLLLSCCWAHQSTSGNH